MKSTEHPLIQEIIDAFKDVHLEDGISLNMTEYHDSGGCMPEFKKKAKTDERKHWYKIDDDTLESFTVTFSFTDLKGFRFYLPAYMIYTIRNHEISDSIITDFTIYALDPNHYIFDETTMKDFFYRKTVQLYYQFLRVLCKTRRYT